LPDDAGGPKHSYFDHGRLLPLKAKTPLANVAAGCAVRNLQMALSIRTVLGCSEVVFQVLSE
jgi:hypothetical protein